MKPARILILPVIILIGLSGCSVSHQLPAGEKLYNGATVQVKVDSASSVSAKKLRKELSPLILPKKNRMIFGFPYKVWFWYAIGEPKKEKGLKYWLRNKLGEPPVLSSRIQPAQTAENLTAYLENNGYFGSRIYGDTLVKGYKFKASYEVHTSDPYRLGRIEWRLDSSLIGKEISRLITRRSLLRKNDRFQVDVIKAERDRIDLRLKTKGYYFFNPDYLVAYTDTSNGNRTANLYMTVKNSTPARALLPQKINSVVVFPNYTLISPPPDTSMRGMLMHDLIYIRDTVHQFKPALFARAITFRPGDTYSLRQQNNTQNRLINLGVFKFVKNRYEAAGGTDTSGLLNVFYYLTPYKNKTIQTEIGAFTKTNSFTGGQLNITWRHRNIFRAAESFQTKAYGAIEASLNDSLRKNNNYRLGAEMSLTFPRYVVPFLKLSEKNPFPPRTRLTLGYEWLRRQALYTRNYFRFQYEIYWKESISKEHTIAPIQVTVNNTRNFSDEYLQQLGVLPSLYYANLPEIILGSFYSYVLNNSFSRGRNIYYFNGNVETAGNLAGLFSGNKQVYTGKLFSAYYAQYIKADLDARYTRRLSGDVHWANRLIIGAGFPYNNSDFLPFSKQYIIGGANSLRGFRPRGIGPGSTRTSALQQLLYPQIGGDYKLEMNSELRFTIAGKLKSAIFLDAGNIWTKGTLLYPSSAQLSKNFWKELGVDGGVGLRYDISLFVLRVDIAFPFSKPWLPEGQRWVLPQFKPGDPDWRSDNLVFNLAIGYPF